MHQPGRHLFCYLTRDTWSDLLEELLSEDNFFVERDISGKTWLAAQSQRSVLNTSSKSAGVGCGLFWWILGMLWNCVRQPAAGIHRRSMGHKAPSRTRHQRGTPPRTHSWGSRTNRSESSSRSSSKWSFGTGTVSSDRTELKKENRGLQILAHQEKIGPSRRIT